MFLRGVRDWGVGGATIAYGRCHDINPTCADWDASIVLDGATLVLEVEERKRFLFLQFDAPQVERYKTPPFFQKFACSKLKA